MIDFQIEAHSSGEFYLKIMKNENLPFFDVFIMHFDDCKM